MIKTAVLSFSDGRQRVHETLRGYIQSCEDSLVDALRNTGQVEVVRFGGIVQSNESALLYAKQLLAADVDACILNVPVFSFPNFSAIVQRLQQIPIIAIAPSNGAYPGLGGLLATVNLIRQVGGQCEKLWGNIGEPHVLQKIMTFLRAAHAVTRLRGQVLGLFGGRSIGIGSGAINPDLMMKLFGVDVEHVDQMEILRRANMVGDDAAEAAICWLTENLGGIAYDGVKLTRESLRLQVKCYIALQQLVQEHSMDFVAVKCHYELSEYNCTQCLSAAFFNDPYDWNGPKEPTVFSCEADGDAALTMQVLKLITGEPVLFMDFRHYMEKENVFAFCNCGASATWYAGRSAHPTGNLKNVSLQPVIPKYAGTGCHVKYMAAPGPMTFARLTREMDVYKLQAFRGDFRQMPERTMELTCPVWPHGYTAVSGDPFQLVQAFACNHIHAVAGDWIDELELWCRLKGVVFELLSPDGECIAAASAE